MTFVADSETAYPSNRGCVSLIKSRKSDQGKSLDHLADINLSAFIWSVTGYIDVPDLVQEEGVAA
jgi:hypothetical protein